MRILEEFRKNPHIKIPPKSPCRNSQSLGKFQNPLEFETPFMLESSPGIQPDQSSFPNPAHPLRRLPPPQPARSACVPLAYSREYVFLLGLCFSPWCLLSSLSPAHGTPLVRPIPILPVPLSWPRHHLFATILAASCPQALNLEVPPQPLYSTP
jgi:hypothetical protein